MDGFSLANSFVCSMDRFADRDTAASRTGRGREDAVVRNLFMKTLPLSLKDYLNLFSRFTKNIVFSDESMWRT